MAACFSELTVDGQYYASSITSHGLLDLCSSYKAGPTWPASVLASVSALDNTGTPTPSTPAPVTTGTVTAVGTGVSTKSTTSSTGSPLPNAASTLARPSLEVSKGREFPVLDMDVDVDITDCARLGVRCSFRYCPGCLGCSGCLERQLEYHSLVA